MRRERICIYGGTNLQRAPIEFITDLAYALLSSTSSVIVTGGFRASNQKPSAVSTDVAALRGAQRYAGEHGAELRDCFEAWIPEPSLDSRPDVRGALRMSEADGITLRVMTGRTPLGRRLAMVAGVDIVVTIAGRQHIEVVVEQALELGVPVLPIPDAGGDSRDLLAKYRTRIAASFEAGALDRCLDRISQAIHRHPEVAARAVVDLLRTAKVGRCLVLMPYDEEHDRLYASTIEPAVSRHMIPSSAPSIPGRTAEPTGRNGDRRPAKAEIRRTLPALPGKIPVRPRSGGAGNVPIPAGIGLRGASPGAGGAAPAPSPAPFFCGSAPPARRRRGRRSGPSVACGSLRHGSGVEAGLRRRGGAPGSLRHAAEDFGWRRLFGSPREGQF